jgi:YD repeat-containing protein
MSGGIDGTFSTGTIYAYSIPSPGTATTGYAGNGNLQLFTDTVNGQWSSIKYDTLNRLSNATLAGTPSNTTLAWTYDPFGNRQSQPPGAVQLSYAAPNNRISTSPYTYDYAGNVTEDVSN